MKCHVCGKQLASHGAGARSLYRINPLGPPGIWSCWEHLTDEEKERLDPETVKLVKIIEDKNAA